MTIRSRVLKQSALSLAMAVTLAACGDERGGILKVIFGANGSGSCDRFEIRIDLEAAGAEVKRDAEEAIECALEEAGLDAECDITAVEVDGFLNVTVKNCSLPEDTSRLFNCLFTEGNLEDLAGNVEGTCPVCSGESECSGGLEIDVCDDDDSNCGDVTTTSTTQESTTTTEGPTTTTTLPDTTTTTEGPTTTTSTTAGPTTTTTLPGDCTLPCALTFRLNDNVNIGSLQWKTSYDAADGSPNGSGPAVDCTNSVSGAFFEKNDNETTSTLEMAFITTTGFQGPTNLAVCNYTACGEAPVAGDFTISDIAATDKDLNDLPAPSLGISQIVCEAPPTTTTLPDTTTTTSSTSSTSTTTTGEPTTTTEGVTTTTLEPTGPKNYAVTYTLTSTPIAVGSLQFDVGYGDATGGFQGAGAAVVCTNSVVGSFFEKNDKEDVEKVTIAWISTSGFGVGVLGNCTFNGDLSDPPVAGDFPLLNVAATDTEFNEISVAVNVAVVPLP